MSKKDKVNTTDGAASKSSSMLASVQAGAVSGVVTDTIQDCAKKEALLIRDARTPRAKIWAYVVRNYSHDLVEMKKYPQALRHEYGKLEGFDFSKPVAQWPEDQQVTYKAFVSNEASPFNRILNWIEGGTHPDKVVELLTGPGTVAQKLKQIPTRNKPVTPREPKTPTALSKPEDEEGKTPTETKGEGKSGSSVDNSGKGLGEGKPFAVAIEAIGNFWKIDNFTDALHKVAVEMKQRQWKEGQAEIILLSEKVEKALGEFDAEMASIHKPVASQQTA